MANILLIIQASWNYLHVVGDEHFQTVKSFHELSIEAIDDLGFKLYTIEAVFIRMQLARINAIN